MTTEALIDWPTAAVYVYVHNQQPNDRRGRCLSCGTQDIDLTDIEIKGEVLRICFACESESSWVQGYVAALHSIVQRCPTATPDVKYLLARKREEYIQLGGG